MNNTLIRSARLASRSLSSISGRRSASTHPLAVKPSRDELSTGRLAARNLEQAVRALHEDGLVVIEDAVPHEDIDRLNGKMVQDALMLQQRGKDMPYNYNVGNSKHAPKNICLVLAPDALYQSSKTRLQSKTSSLLRSSSTLSPLTSQQPTSAQSPNGPSAPATPPCQTRLRNASQSTLMPTLHTLLTLSPW